MYNLTLVPFSSYMKIYKCIHRLGKYATDVSAPTPKNILNPPVISAVSAKMSTGHF